MGSVGSGAMVGPLGISSRCIQARGVPGDAAGKEEFIQWSSEVTWLSETSEELRTAQVTGTSHPCRHDVF